MANIAFVQSQVVDTQQATQGGDLIFVAQGVQLATTLVGASFRVGGAGNTFLINGHVTAGGTSIFSDELAPSTNNLLQVTGALTSAGFKSIVELRGAGNVVHNSGSIVNVNDRSDEMRCCSAQAVQSPTPV